MTTAQFKAEIAALLVQTIVWEPMTSRDSFGDPQYGPAQTFSPANQQGGRRVYKEVRVPNPGPGPGGSGVIFVNGSYIWLLATPAIKRDDRVYVQGDAAPYPAILNIEKFPDETGEPFYTKITLGGSN